VIVNLPTGLTDGSCLLWVIDDYRYANYRKTCRRFDWRYQRCLTTRSNAVSRTTITARVYRTGNLYTCVEIDNIVSQINEAVNNGGGSTQPTNPSRYETVVSAGRYKSCGFIANVPHITG
jgi:hypothetical protein